MPKLGKTVEIDFADLDGLRLKKQPGLAEPERTLWFAVLEQAFRDAIGGDTKEHSPLWRGDALVWLRSNATDVGSLRWVIDATGINTTVQAIRERLVRRGDIGRARRQYRDG